MTREKRHAEIVNFFNSLKNEEGENVFNLKKYPNLRNRDQIEKTLDYEEVLKMTPVLCEVFSIMSGSAGDINFYKLFETYLLDAEKRKRINEIM